MILLEVLNAVKNFGGLRANDDISFRVEKGELVGLIGPNGAGKTTLFNCISGLHPVNSGRILFEGHDITGLRDFETVRRGLARTFQVYMAAGDLSVLEHVMVGCFMGTRSRAKARARAEQILADFGLRDISHAFLTELPVASQKCVSMATAVGTEPKMLLLDEVAAGLNPTEVEEVISMIRHIHYDLQITVMLIEHVMELVMKLSDRVIVLDAGQKIAEGDPHAVVQDPIVIKAYLGESYLQRPEGA